MFIEVSDLVGFLGVVGGFVGFLRKFVICLFVLVFIILKVVVFLWGMVR